MKYVGAVIGLMLVSAATLAAAASPADRALLEERFGKPTVSVVISSMTAVEQEQLNKLLSDPVTKEYPSIRASQLQSFLFSVYGRECTSWQHDHLTSQCPPLTGEAAGQAVADAHCSTCHLFGTADAPTFAALARSGIDARRIEGALASGHRMSPIHLENVELMSLTAFINALR